MDLQADSKEKEIQQMERIMTDHFAERTAKANRTWLPKDKIYNSFSHSPRENYNCESALFSKGQLNYEIENAKIIL